MKQPTKIEYLDARYPGLANDVRKWFDQGVTTDKIVGLLFERYGVSLSRSPIIRFRTKRWAPERQRLEEKRMDARVAMELQREQEIIASIISPIPKKGDRAKGE